MNNIYTILYLALYVIQNSILSSELEDYIVVLKKTKSARPHNLSQNTKSNSFVSVLENYNLKIKFNYTLIPGYLVSMSEKEYKKLSKDKDVLFVEKDQPVELSEVQSKASWGLARLETIKKLESITKNVYYYDTDSGKDVNVYVLDSGVDLAHSEFENRAESLLNPFADIKGDPVGHGTHVAGIVSGKTYGVSRKARIYSINMLGHKPYRFSKVAAGLEKAIKHSRSNKDIKGNVINMSFGGKEGSEAVDKYLEIATRENIVLVASASNYHKDACNYYPASSPHVITVGATDITDKFASYSNYGECVNILAPGTEILSAGIGHNEKSVTKSGTSMAAAHVSGLIAYIMSRSQVRLTNKQILESLMKHANHSKITEVPKNTPNSLAFNYVAPKK